MTKPNLYFGKISQKFPIQITENFYGGGAKDSTWYGGIDIGDYVFPIYQGKVSKLWQLMAFEKRPNAMNRDGVAQFKVVKEYAEPIRVSDKFSRYQGFHLDLNMLNKSVKSTAVAAQAFFPIATTADCPSPENIHFSNIRKIYIALAEPFKNINYQEGDLRIKIADSTTYEIEGIEIYQSGAFANYATLQELYLSKNPTDKRYSLVQLLEYARTDAASNKEKYLSAVINGLKKEGYFLVTNPVKLYDNVLVGRKKTSRKKKVKPIEVTTPSIVDNTEAIEVVEISETEEDYDAYASFVELLNYNPNLILYGPPGTGKTYSLEKIIEAFEYERTKTPVPFSDLMEKGRISYVTFHQSFSYEEFVEGLRPVTVQSDDTEQKGAELQYKVEDGVLLRIADRAVRGQLQEEFTADEFKNVGDNTRIWKISLGSRGKEEELYKKCLASNTIAIDWLTGHDLSNWDKDMIFETLKKESDNSNNPTNDADSIYKFTQEVSLGDIVLVFASVTAIRAIGVVDGDYYLASTEKYYQHRRPVKWLEVFDEPLDILKYNNNVRLTLKTVYELKRFKFSDIREMLTPTNTIAQSENHLSIPYFLVIDEINRGNISKIFGELITLIEKDKRDKIKLELPYSRKLFSLPSNLYIIGTMNTADRSIAILDTALRRRFVFKEIEPNSDIIRDDRPLNDDDVDVALILDKLNKIITEKIDRDHRIGHAYFLQAFDLNQLKIVWYYQIIPLLMEYFYNDGETIASMITDAFFDKNTCQVQWIEDNDKFKQALLNIK